MTRGPVLAPVALVALAVLAACGDDPLPVEELMKPETCQACHPNHFREWSGSMHAYAGDDPVFLAMNAKGQEETGGALGGFCVQCHAPLALQLGLTTDGLNLPDVPQWAKGVGCYSCHNVVEVTGTHNNPLRLAMDQTMRGGLRDAVESPAHRTAYSSLLDAESQGSSAMCGSCHDIVTPAGVHLERTFSEWQETIFAHASPLRHVSCAACHMVPSTDVIAEGPGLDVPLRPYGRREHTFAGLDVALTPWPEVEGQLAAIRRDLQAVLLPRLCVVPADAGRIDYRLDNVGAGHMFPSGATADRRAWIELVAYGENDEVLFSTGVIPPGQPYTDPEALGDPNLWILGTPTRDAQGQPTELFWRIATIDHPGTLLPPAVTTDPQDPRFYHAVERSFGVPGLLPSIRRVTARVLVRPIPFALLEELMASGHLTLDLRDQVPTHVVGGSVLEWRPGGDACVCPQGPPCP
ncbi:MAG: hypothetical protein HS111_39350 [Kofleriaceae bacterium]|nr:hypothetical protein [Kofleriaceae bacterium]MCL4226889.1 cytochrome c family protein [Myxococcales bacterium]